MWWKDEVKVAVRRKEVLAASKKAKERCIEAYKEENRKIKRSVYHSKKKVKEDLYFIMV